MRGWNDARFGRKKEQALPSSGLKRVTSNRLPSVSLRRRSVHRPQRVGALDVARRNLCRRRSERSVPYNGAGRSKRGERYGGIAADSDNQRPGSPTPGRLFGGNVGERREVDIRSGAGWRGPFGRPGGTRRCRGPDAPGFSEHWRRSRESAGAGFDNVVEFTTYVVGRDSVQAFIDGRTRSSRTFSPTATIRPIPCWWSDGLVREEFLVEIKAVAALP